MKRSSRNWKKKRDGGQERWRSRKKKIKKAKRKRKLHRQRSK